MATVKDTSAKDLALEDAQLREAGFDPAAPPADAIVRLESLRSAEGVSEAAIARALSKIPTAESAAMLTRMETQAAGAARREIRRALFKLRQRGIAAPAPASPAPSPDTATIGASEVGLTALLSPVDADGAIRIDSRITVYRIEIERGKESLRQDGPNLSLPSF